MESRRDSVTNIVDEVRAAPSLSEIKNAIIGQLEELSGALIEQGELREKERDTAQALYDSHYQHPEWNLGTLAKFTS